MLMAFYQWRKRKRPADDLRGVPGFKLIGQQLMSGAAA